MELEPMLIWHLIDNCPYSVIHVAKVPGGVLIKTYSQSVTYAPGAILSDFGVSE